MKEPIEYVFLAGIGNSEPGHWQSHWYPEPRLARSLARTPRLERAARPANGSLTWKACSTG